MLDYTACINTKARQAWTKREPHKSWAEWLVRQKLRPSGADIFQQLGHGVDADIGHAGDRPHGHALYQQGDDLDALFDGEGVHVSSFCLN